MGLPRSILPVDEYRVLSPNTEAFDRGEKFNRLQTWNPTLQDYVLVSQDQAKIEHFRRGADGNWEYRRTMGLESSLEVPSIECTLKLADVYDRVAFPSKTRPGKPRKRG